MTSVEMFVTVKFRDRKSEGGISGCSRLRMRGVRAIVATAPRARATYADASRHWRCWPRMVPYASPPTATATTAAPSQSNRGDISSSRDSWTWPRVAHSTTAMNGMMMRNAARHQQRPHGPLEQAEHDERLEVPRQTARQ